jgi:hypothetical protein
MIIQSTYKLIQRDNGSQHSAYRVVAERKLLSQPARAVKRSS